MPKNRETAIAVLLWSIVGAGMVIRLANPFFNNPMDFLESDPLRHFLNARDCLRTGQDISVVYEILDPLGYQIWLSSVLRITAGERTAIALYAGLLSIVTTWLWYRWMQLCVQNRLWALAGYALLSLLPDWIRVYQFFLQETLVLPLLGLALWLSWEVEQRPSTTKYIATGFVWGCALLTKLTVLPMAVIVLGWLAHKAAPERVRRRLPLIAVAIALSLYALEPIKIFNRIHAFVPIPGNDLNRAWYESGKKNLKYKIKFFDNQQGSKEYEVTVGHPSLDLKAPLGIEWTTSRIGTCETTIDYTEPFSRYLPTTNMTIQDRLHYTMENFIYFFFGLSWPENHMMKDLQNPMLSGLLQSERFVWLPITVAIIYLAIRKKRLDIMTVLFCGSLMFFILQQSLIFEARYRKPWEGVAIATILALVAKPKQRIAPESNQKESAESGM